MTGTVPLLDQEIKLAGERLIHNLSTNHPDLDFIMVLLPYSRIQTRHLSGEQIVQLERRVGYAARKALSDAIKEAAE